MLDSKQKMFPATPLHFQKLAHISFQILHFPGWFRLFYEMHVTALCWFVNSHNCALGGMVTLTCCTSYINKLAHSLNTPHLFLGKKLFFEILLSVLVKWTMSWKATLLSRLQDDVISDKVENSDLLIWILNARFQGRPHCSDSIFFCDIFNGMF